MEFKPIETQEELDAIISERLKRDREARDKKYSGYISEEELNQKTKDYEERISTLEKELKEASDKGKNHDAELAERDNKIKAYETRSVKSRVAHELGLSYEAVDFLQGDNEDEIKKSAAKLKGLFKVTTPPLASTESGTGSDKDAALNKMVANLTK